MLSLQRREVVDRIRTRLLELCDDEHSICQVAAKHKIFCQGFSRLDSAELREKYDWLQKKADHRLTRSELEGQANEWELARQIYHDVEIACDAEVHDRDQCTGWDGFSDEQLSSYYEELLGESVNVEADA
jgi:hypothetical protein